MDMKKMMKQAQQMQREMNRVQEELKTMEYEATAGGGMVKAVVSGEGLIKSLTIDPEAVDPEDVEMLQDMVIVAINDALRNMTEISNERMNAVTSGMKIPGM